MGWLSGLAPKWISTHLPEVPVKRDVPLVTYPDDNDYEVVTEVGFNGRSVTTVTPKVKAEKMSEIGKRLHNLLLNPSLNWRIHVTSKNEKDEKEVAIWCVRDRCEGSPLAGAVTLRIYFWPNVGNGKWECSQITHGLNWHDENIIKKTLLNMLHHHQSEEESKALAESEATLASWEQWIASKTALEGSGQVAT